MLLGERLLLSIDLISMPALFFRAMREAEGIAVQYQKEGEMYKGIKADLGLNEDQLLSYIGVRTIANAKNPVYVGIQAPAKSSYISP